MKKSYILWVFISLICFTSQATIWRVNNQSTSTAVFTTVQAAIDDDRVSNGDTILIEGSPDVYSGFDVDKRLVILGSGFFLNENPKASLEGVLSVVSDYVDLLDGSQGSVISSLVFSNSSLATPRISVNNIWLARCYFANDVYVSDDISGLLVTENYFANKGIEYSSLASLQGTVFKNNIVKANFTILSDSNDPRTFAAVENNLFLGDVAVTTSTYRNNIWLPLEASTINVTAGIKEYNLNVSVDMGTENNNQVINGLTDLYTGSGSTDGKWQIKSDSEYKNSGKDGTDPGPYGGSNPYVLSGLPSLPIIYEISTTGFGSADEGLPVTIKVRSN